MRPPPEVYLEKMRKIAEEEKKERAEENKRTVSENEQEEIHMSKSKRKKLEKKEQKEKWKIMKEQKTDYQSCDWPDCSIPCSQKCDSRLCRKCCREKAAKEPLVCEVTTFITHFLESFNYISINKFKATSVSTLE